MRNISLLSCFQHHFVVSCSDEDTLPEPFEINPSDFNRLLVKVFPFILLSSF